MAAPFIDLQIYTIPVNLDLSSVTSSGDAWDSLDGDISSDWYKAEFSLDSVRRKRFGSGRIALAFFDDSGDAITTGVNGTRQIYAINKDWKGSDQNGVPGLQLFNVLTPAFGATPNSKINWGVRWQIEADQKLRELVLINDVYFYDGAVWTFKASIGDGSSADKIISMPNNNYGGFQSGDATVRCLYRSLVPTLITLELRRVAGPAVTSFVLPIAGYLRMPIAPPQPGTYKQMTRSRTGVARG